MQHGSRHHQKIDLRLAQPTLLTTHNPTAPKLANLPQRQSRLHPRQQLLRLPPRVAGTRIRRALGLNGRSGSKLHAPAIDARELVTVQRELRKFLVRAQHERFLRGFPGGAGCRIFQTYRAE